MTIRDAYLFGREHLAASGSLEAAVEAEMLLRFVVGVDRAHFYTHWDTSLVEPAWTRYRSLLDERAAGRPVHYIVGEREFMGLPFAVDERVMIPRPETEVLVEFAVARLRDLHSRPVVPSSGRSEIIAAFPRGAGRPGPVIVDVGTGSGCIAVSVAHRLPEARVVAIDLSPGALEVARANAARHSVADRVMLLQGDLLAPLPLALLRGIDAVLSNPPYVPEDQASLLPRGVRDFEPHEALFAPGDGLLNHRRLADAAPSWLRPGGLLAMEVGAGQAEPVAGVLEASGAYSAMGIEPDGVGIGRVVWGTVEK